MMTSKKVREDALKGLEDLDEAISKIDTHSECLKYWAFPKGKETLDKLTDELYEVAEKCQKIFSEVELKCVD